MEEFHKLKRGKMKWLAQNLLYIRAETNEEDVRPVHRADGSNI